MVKGGGVGAILVRGRAPIVLALLVLGGALLLKSDFTRHARPILRGRPQVSAALAQLPLSFEPNQGQADSQVKFLARGAGYALYLTRSGADLALPHAHSDHTASDRSIVQMQFAAAANPSPHLDALEPQPGQSNYFLGNDPSRWRRSVPHFARVRYRDLYPGVDLDFYGNQGRLEYDFEVNPGADPQKIELKFQGTNALHLSGNGDLVLNIPGRELKFEAPRVYQKTANGIQIIPGAFVLRGKDQAGFEVGNYDRGRQLVIDPVLSFSTYFGGSGAESCSAITGAQFVPQCPAIAVDSAARVYIAGATTSTSGFPAATVTNPKIGAGGNSDVFVARVSNSGSALTLDYITFLGGSGMDYPTGVGVDSGFNVYVAGTTASSDFPVVNELQSSPGSASNHVFATELDSSGSANLYSTYLSSSGTDTASGMVVDSRGKIYIFGITTTPGAPGTASTFPTTPGALQASAAAPSQFFFTKLDPTTSGPNSLLYSTFIGGSSPSTGLVTGGGIAVDSAFNVYLAGGTNFVDMPVVNAYVGTAQQGQSTRCGFDVWAARLNAPANNTQLYTPEFETYFGDPGPSSGVCPSGAGDDIAYGVTTDGTNTYITGSTRSSNITIPSGTTAFQTCLDQPPPNPSSCSAPGSPAPRDAFIAKFGLPAVTGTAQGATPLNFFSYLGGSGDDVGTAIAADTNANARVVGWTNSGDFPSSPTFGSPGGISAFFGRIVTNGATTTATNTSATSLLGGSGTDIATSTAVDAALNSYVAGETSSGNFPVSTSPAPVQSALSGASDSFIAKLGPNTSGLSFSCGSQCPSPAPANPTVSPSPVGVGNTVTFTYSIYNTGDPVTGAVFTANVPGGNSKVTGATAAPGNCTVNSTDGSAVCNLGTVNTSTTTSTTTGGTTTTTISAADTVTLTVTPTVPAQSVPPTKPPNVGSSGTLTIAGTTFQQTASGQASVNDFGLTVSPASQTVTAGAQATYNITVTPTGPIPESVSLACGSGVPSGAACSLSNNPIASLNSGAQSRTLQITTTARVTTPASLFRRGSFLYAFWFPVSGLALVGSGLSRKRRRWLIALLGAAVLGGVALQAGCSKSSSTSTTSGTPAGTYTITLNATSGSATRTTALQLIVQ